MIKKKMLNKVQSKYAWDTIPSYKILPSAPLQSHFTRPNEV